MTLTDVVIKSSNIFVYYVIRCNSYHQVNGNLHQKQRLLLLMGQLVEDYGQFYIAIS